MGAHGAGCDFARRSGSGKKLAVWGVTASVLASSLATAISGFCVQAEAAGNSGARSSYRHPVEGPIIRRFEEPEGPYASGHRGIDYGVAPRTSVRASNAGTVKFAGPVAADGLFVTIRHSGGLETLYSYLSAIEVSAGGHVARGQQIGLSGDGHPGENVPSLHFGMKRDGRYIDPELVLSGSNDISDALALVPVRERPGPGESTSNASGSYGSFFGDPQGSNPGFSTGPGGSGGRLRGGDAYGSSGGPENFRGSGSRARKSGVGEEAGSGQSAGHRQGSSWEKNRDRLGRFFVGNSEAESGSKEGGQKGQLQNRKKAPSRDSGRSSWAGFLSPRAMWGTFGRFAGQGSRALGTWTGKQMEKVESFAISRWEKFKAWLAKQSDKVGNFIEPPAGSGLESFIPGLTSGVFHQISCSLRGGDPPPKMPTSQQVQRGEGRPPPAPSDNIVMVLGGLGSSSREENGKVTGRASLFNLDFRTLGFKEEQIYHYSYKGVEKRGGTGPYRIHAPYERTDTYNHIGGSARVLDEQLQEIHKQHPGKKIDLVAHSEGGLVASYFVARIYRENNPKQPKLGHLVTLNTPHQGADLARMGELFSDTATGRVTRPVAELLSGKLAGAPPATAPVLSQVEEDSTFVKELKKSGYADKVKTTTIATAWDLVVTAPHSSVPGSDHFTTDLEGFSFANFFKAHSLAAGAPVTQGLMYNALADKRSQCTAFRNAFGRYVSGSAISTLQDGAIHAAQGQFYATDWWASMGGSTRRMPEPVHKP